MKKDFEKILISKEQIAELTGLNPQSVVRMVNVVLPQVDKEMSEKVMNYIADSKPVCKVEVADAPVELKTGDVISDGSIKSSEGIKSIQGEVVESKPDLILSLS